MSHRHDHLSKKNLTYAFSEIPSSTSLKIYHYGPDLRFGPLPTFFYFALAGDESLTQPPYNQPVTFFEGKAVRSFSFTLPFHGPGFDNKLAIEHWAREMEEGSTFFSDFILLALQNMQTLIDYGYVDEKQIAAGGLSRGAFVASHFASLDTRVKWLLGYAPLTHLDYVSEFKKLTHNPLVEGLNLTHIIPKLIDKQVRFYIGNRDIRVGTEYAFHFIKSLADTAYNHGVRSPHADLIITPSVGHKGHGTLPHIFQDGIDWLCEKWHI